MTTQEQMKKEVLQVDPEALIIRLSKKHTGFFFLDCCDQPTYTSTINILSGGVDDEGDLEFWILEDLKKLNN